jgi:4-amino-4-deoxy-L-arabinose transferase-like glycosyltransferase
MRSATILFALALIVRVGFEFATGSFDRPLSGDEIEFSEIGANVADGRGFSRNGTDPTAQRLPGYPTFLAVVSLVAGPSIVAQRLANVVLASLLVACIAQLGRTIFGSTVGIIAGILAVFHLPFIENAGYVMSDTAFTLLCTLVLLAAGDGRAEWNVRRAARFGATIGLAALFRAEILLFGGLSLAFVIASTASWRQRLRVVAAFVAPLLLIVGPWVVRNYTQLGKVQMATVGHVLVGIYNDTMFTTDHEMGGWDPEPRELRNANAKRVEDREPGITYVPEPEWDHELTQRALTSMRDHAALLPRMTLYKLHALAFDAGTIRALYRAPLTYLFVFGVLVAIASGLTRQVAFLLIFVLYTVFVTILLYVNARLRMSMDVPFLLLVAFGLQQHRRLLAWLRSERVHA